MAHTSTHNWSKCRELSDGGGSATKMGQLRPHQSPKLRTTWKEADQQEEPEVGGLQQSAPVDLSRAAGDCVGWRVLSLRVWYPVDQPRSRWGWIKEELRGRTTLRVDIIKKYMTFSKTKIKILTTE